MKKKFVLLIGIVIVVLNLLSSKAEDTAVNKLLLENVEAMASPEVEIEAICMGSSGVCIVYSNGFFYIWAKSSLKL